MTEEKKTEQKKVEPTVKKQIDGASKPIFAWKSPDAVVVERGGNWHVIIVVAAAVLAGLLYWQGLLTGVVLVVVAAVILVMTSRLKPREVKCAIFAEGIVVDDKAYEYGEFKSFWLSAGELPKLKLQRTGRIAGQVEMPLSNIDINQIRLYVSKHLPQEDDKGEDLVDYINRILRF